MLLRLKLIWREAGREARGVDEVMLAATSLPKGPIIHVPHIFCHVSSQDDPAERIIAVNRHLEPTGAIVRLGRLEPSRCWPLPEVPLVTIVVPTRDRVDLLHACIESVLGRTDYIASKFVIDNESAETPPKNFSGRSRNDRLRAVDCPEGYNFSAINNFAVRRPRLVFLLAQ